MTSEKQIAANRQNANRSTGPKTEKGKLRSRKNAFRHGLTAETIIDVLENTADYEAFEAEIKAGYEPRTAVEHALIVRLASLLWRLRRATAMESGLLQIQAGMLTVQKTHNYAAGRSTTEKWKVVHSVIPFLSEQTKSERANQQYDTAEPYLDEILNVIGSAKLDLARSFLGVTNLDNSVFEKLGRYEKSLWRQTAQIIVLLNSFRRRADNLCRRRSRQIGAARRRRRPFFPAHFFERV